MYLFSIIFFKILSSLLSVVVGYLSGKFTKVEQESIASLLLYFVAPIVFFAIPTNSKLSITTFSITLITFIISTIIGLLAYWLYGKIWHDNHRNIIALSAGTGNNGYIVLPIAAAIFDDYTLSIYALGLIGVSIYEVSIGCFFCARSINSFKKSIIQVIKLPIFNAFFLGCILSMLGFQLPSCFDTFVSDMKGAYSILGIVIIGISLSKITSFKLDLKFTAAMLANKFLFMPILFNIFILLDQFIFHYYTIEHYNAIRLITLSPIATNVLIISYLYKIQPEKIATIVLISLLFVLIYIPIMVTLLLHNISASL